MSLKLVPSERLDAVSYSPSVVTMAVSVAVFEIFSVKKCSYLENQVRGCSRLLKTAPFDRPYVTFYQSAIVNIALLVSFSNLTLNNTVTLKSGLEVTHTRSSKLVPFESLGAVSYSPSIVPMAISCIVCETQRPIGRKSRKFLYPTCIQRPRSR